MADSAEPHIEPQERTITIPTQHFRVMFVCTANLCRSPMAEELLRSAVRSRPDAERWAISSAGVRAHTGRGLHPLTAAVLTERGIDGSSFTSRPLAEADAKSQDLVLTATRAHRAAVIRHTPSLLNRTFTIRQFSYLLEGAEPLPAAPIDTAGRDWVARARAARSDKPGRTEQDDIADPVNEPIGAFQQLADELVVLLDIALRVVPPG